MPNHERFEELCAMAAVGEISVEERRELMTHLENCASCEKAYSAMNEIHSTWLPEREGFEIKRSFGAESNLRHEILQRATAEGARFSDEVLLPPPPSSNLATLRYRRYQRVLYRVFAVAAVVVLAVAGVGVLERMKSHRSDSQAAATVHTTGNSLVPSTATSVGPDQLEAPRDSARRAREAQGKLETNLQQAEAARQELKGKLADAEQRTSTAQQATGAALQEVSDLRAQLEAARTDESKVEAQLGALKSSHADQAVELSLVRTENENLREKLSQQVASVDRERELMADGREIRDLIAARNLHIIDVYDTSGEGQTGKSFGRVFYTEGKSLVFYAYDLPARRPMTKYAYYAWGKRDVSGDVKVRNLGIFYNDDQAQRRWVLKINDPNVLSEIDSVFVTLEKTDDSGKTPTGKKLLSAYLGTPANHP